MATLSQPLLRQQDEGQHEQLHPVAIGNGEEAQQHEDHHHHHHHHLVAPPPDTFWPTTMNLAKAILGAGMMVLPKAFMLLGAAIGSVMLIGVAALTWFSIGGLIYAAEKTGKRTYGSAVRMICGKYAKYGLLVAVIANCFGLMVVFTVVFRDILLGVPPEHHGLLRQFMPWLDPAAWYMDPRVVLAGVNVVVLAPLSALHNMSRLGFMNIVGVAAVVALTLTTVWLAAAAAWTGTAYPIQWAPDLAALGRSDVAVTLAMLSIIPIFLNADVCHQAVFPAMPLLQPYTRRRMNTVIALALASCNTMYLVISLCTCATFGPRLSDNVLNNLNVAEMSPLIGDLPAVVTAAVVRLGYFVSVVGSYALAMHPLRQCMMELVLGKRFHALQGVVHEHPLFYPFTIVALLSIYSTAVFAPSIWIVLSLVGSAASTMMGFIFPAWVIYITMRRKRWTHKLKRGVALVLGFLGVFLFINGFAVFFV